MTVPSALGVMMPVVVGLGLAASPDARVLNDTSPTTASAPAMAAETTPRNKFDECLALVMKTRSFRVMAPGAGVSRAKGRVVKQMGGQTRAHERDASASTLAGCS